MPVIANSFPKKHETIVVKEVVGLTNQCGESDEAFGRLTSGWSDLILLQHWSDFTRRLFPCPGDFTFDGTGDQLMGVDKVLTNVITPRQFQQMKCGCMHRVTLVV